ncbi:MAG: FadR family transcriptional regulator [Geminicoccaceae bacterium]|nr:FadR family transcriptional regulator [Geminicoccaceae bacterium]
MAAPPTAQDGLLGRRRARSNHQMIARDLGAEIVRGNLPAGTIIPSEAALVERFGVSRPVIREVVRTLAAKGLVVSKTKVGTRVTDRAEWNLFDPDVIAWHLDGDGADPRFLRDLYEIRACVEPMAASLSAARRTGDDLHTLREAVARMAAYADRTDFARADLAFHLAIALVCRNPFMRSIGGVIEAALFVTLRLSSPLDEAEHGRSVADHGTIVDAIEAGDGPGAAQAMRRVIDVGRSRIADGV